MSVSVIIKILRFHSYLCSLPISNFNLRMTRISSWAISSTAILLCSKPPTWLCTTFQTREVAIFDGLGERWQSWWQQPSFVLPSNQIHPKFNPVTNRVSAGVHNIFYILKTKLTLIPIILLIHGSSRPHSDVWRSHRSSLFPILLWNFPVFFWWQSSCKITEKRACFGDEIDYVLRYLVSWYPSIMKTVSFLDLVKLPTLVPVRSSLSLRCSRWSSFNRKCDTELLCRSCSTTMRTSGSFWISIRGLWVWAAQISKNVWQRCLPQVWYYLFSFIILTFMCIFQKDLPIIKRFAQRQMYVGIDVIEGLLWFAKRQLLTHWKEIDYCLATFMGSIHLIKDALSI